MLALLFTLEESTAHRAVATVAVAHKRTVLHWKAASCRYMFRVKPNFKRRPPRLGRVFNDRPLYFITFCTHQRKPFLACDEVHAAFAVFAKRAETSFNVAVGRYVIMPDHIHLFVRGADDFRLGHWIGLLKQVLGKASENAPMAGR